MEKKIKMKTYSTCRLVKGEDLNHHQTLFAGRSAEWLVESGFVAASSLIHPARLICVQIHGMSFTRPVYPGEVICYTSSIVFAGRTSLIAYIKAVVNASEKVIQVDGFVSFVHVDEHTRPVPHGLQIVAASKEEKMIQEKASQLKKKK